MDLITISRSVSAVISDSDAGKVSPLTIDEDGSSTPYLRCLE